MATATKTKKAPAKKKKAPAPDPTVTFVAWCRNQHVVVEPRKRVFERDAAGNVIATHTTEGKSVHFKNWQYATDDAELIEALRSHELFESPKGWREAYDASRPSLAEQTKTIARLAAEQDADALRELIVAEESAGDGGRDDVLEAARDALSTIEGTGAEAAGDSQPTDDAETSEAEDDAPTGD